MITLKSFFKTSFLSLFIVSLFFTSCKKDNNDDDGGGGGSNSENSFTINGTEYKATTISYIEELNVLRAQRITPTSGLNEIQSLSIEFSDDMLPTTGGSFDIVSDPYSPNDKTNNNQVSVSATTFPHMNGSMAEDLFYNPILSPVQKVTVTINDSKLNVKFTNLSFKTDKGENASISANISLQMDH